jgi:lysophospholipase L1-like esterase
VTSPTSPSRRLGCRASIGANVVFVAVAILYFIRREAVTREAERREAIMYAQRASRFESLPPVRRGTVFLGDSLTAGGEWAETFGDPTIMNRGIPGETTRGVLARLDPITAGAPAKVFLMIGVNDLEAGVPVADIVANVGRILAAFAAQAPETAVFVQSALPLRAALFSGPIRNADIAALNRGLEAAAAEHRARYVDVASALTDGAGELDERYTLDGIHLTGAGYAAWKAVIEGLVRGPRGPSPPTPSP